MRHQCELERAANFGAECVSRRGQVLGGGIALRPGDALARATLASELDRLADADLEVVERLRAVDARATRRASDRRVVDVLPSLLEIAARFIDLLIEMAQTTQLIMITHNKLTMEVASRLYGVTMEEKGVSKLVSVELEELQPEEERRATA